jgi:hypothetical protein
MPTMSTFVLAAIAIVAALLVARLRRIVASTNSRGALWVSLVLCIATPIGFLVALNTGVVPSTVTNFTLVVVAVIYFGVIQSYRIDRDNRRRRQGGA